MNTFNLFQKSFLYGSSTFRHDAKVSQISHSSLLEKLKNIFGLDEVWTLPTKLPRSSGFHSNISRQRFLLQSFPLVLLHDKVTQFTLGGTNVGRLYAHMTSNLPIVTSRKHCWSKNRTREQTRLNALTLRLSDQRFNHLCHFHTADEFV